MSLENLFNSLQNLFSGGQDQPQEKEKQSEGLMSSSLRPRARPEGVNVSLRPRARPTSVNIDDNNPVDYAAATINSINDPDYNDDDDTTVNVSLRPKARPAGVTLDSADAQDVLLDPSTLHSTYNTSMAKAGADFTVKMQKFKSAELDSVLNYAKQKEESFNAAMASARDALNVPLRPKARPYQVGEAKEPDYTFTEKDRIKEIQQDLNAAGVTVNGKKLVVDGIKGDNTKKAIRAFQKREGLKVDGVVGDNTKAAFRRVLPQPAVEASELDTELASSKGIGAPPVKMAGVATVKLPFLNKILDNDYIKLATSTPAKLLIKNIMGLDRNQIMGNIPITITEASFKEDELQHYRNMWNQYGQGTVTKAQQIDSAKDALQVATGKDKSALSLPANMRAYFSVGDTFLYQADENDASLMEGVEVGDVILKDQYDYNLYTDYTAEPIINKDGEKEYPRLSTEEFEASELGFSTAKGVKDTLAAYTSGKIGFLSAAHNLGFLLGSRDYQDPDKDDGIPMLLNLGNPETWEPEVMGEPTGEGLMMRPRARPEGLESTAIPEGQELKVNNLTIVNATRGDGGAYRGTKNMFNISLDYNSHSSYASGTEVIIPDNADEATRKAADEFNKAMVAFAKKHGIKGYKNRGIFTTSENAKRKGGERGGAANTIHAEPFFIQDKKMVAAVKNNFKEFSQIYVDVFGSLPARIVAPHGVGGDVGKVSEEFGSELEFGKDIIATLMGN